MVDDTVSVLAPCESRVQPLECTTTRFPISDFLIPDPPASMLLGYVSDERYIALSGVEVELRSSHGSIAARSRASGAIHAEIDPGRYEAILAQPAGSVAGQSLPWASGKSEIARPAC